MPLPSDYSSQLVPATPCLKVTFDRSDGSPCAAVVPHISLVHNEGVATESPNPLRAGRFQGKKQTTDF